MQASTNTLDVQEILNKKARQKSLLTTLIPFTGLVFIFVFFTLVTEGKMLNGGNLTNLISQCFSVSIVAVGASFVYAHGGMDFSIGASCGVAQLVAALIITRSGLPVWIAILACIVVAVVCATLVGATSAFLRVPVFVVSLCMRAICMGILTVGIAESDISIDYMRFAGFNDELLKLIVLLVFIGAGYYLFEYTSLGKSEKAIGGNILTAFQAGVKVKKTQIAAYTLMGLCVGIAGFFQMTRTGGVTGSSGSGLEFDIMVAIVLGGFPMMGGSAARLRSVIIGAFTITILSNGLVLWGLDYLLVNGVKGLLFLIIVAISYDRTNQSQMNFTGS
jgi:Ribose/xylose/arabinose/galactoside ABC-type transport systems, permease components